jgi:hypothetical protein
VVAFVVEIEEVEVVVIIIVVVLVVMVVLVVEKNGSTAHNRPLGHVNELQSVIFFGIHFPL